VLREAASGCSPTQRRIYTLDLASRPACPSGEIGGNSFCTIARPSASCRNSDGVISTHRGVCATCWVISPL
jgi:hypothetical protein